MEWFELEGTSKSTTFQPLTLGMDISHLDQAAPSGI